MASVSSDNLVLAGDGVLNTDSDSFLTGRQVAETSDLLFLVQAIGGHFHTSEDEYVSMYSRRRLENIKRIVHTGQQPCRSTSA